MFLRCFSTLHHIPFTHGLVEAYHYPLGRFVLLHPAAADYPLVYLLLIALHSDSFQHLLLSSIHEKLHLDPHHLVVFLQTSFIIESWETAGGLITIIKVSKYN
ncbi:uncharacterized protein LOC132633062 isoform X2 [Lycium barbarum]|uniref:uncharacterized protein LOC132633062 isoform X2 n=1 Tax=Lycium barbarum TaxID=112863 RepID=UPI00293E8008|nr:uncharacterized protein LOC132633062 isoform X2 [Lycium barbarum]